MRKEKRWMPSYIEGEKNRHSDSQAGRLMQVCRLCVRNKKRGRNKWIAEEIKEDATRSKW